MCALVQMIQQFYVTINFHGILHSISLNKHPMIAHLMFLFENFKPIVLKSEFPMALFLHWPVNDRVIFKSIFAKVSVFNDIAVMCL